MDRELQKSGNGFGGIVGQDMPVQVLNHLLELGKLPGTLLFSGPGGVGKYAAAISLAKILHCLKDKKPDCDCKSCNAIRVGTHPDVIVLSREKSIGVEEMRELITIAALRSSRSHERTIIIDNAENITTPAANAALKALEEPGDHVRFILVTDTPEALLPTVRSRSYRLRFSLVDHARMVEFARTIGDDPDESDAKGAIRFARGRPGTYLRFMHSENYRQVVNEVREWIAGTVKSGGKPRIKDAIEWKGKFWTMAEKLTDAEQSMSIPRGGDTFDLKRSFESEGKFILAPSNWKTEHGSGSEKRWTQGRRAILLTGLLRRILYMELDERSVNAIGLLYDFMEKLRFNCSFDIALERLYYGLSGFKG